MVRQVASRVPGATITGILVQSMVEGGRELIAGAIRDPLLGPLVMFGLGGIFVEVLRDVVFRVAPLHEDDAMDMTRAIQGARILGAIRGMDPVDHTALANVLVRLSHLATNHPEVAELDVNPLLAFPHGVIAVDARVRIVAPLRDIGE